MSIEKKLFSLEKDNCTIKMEGYNTEDVLKVLKVLGSDLNYKEPLKENTCNVETKNKTFKKELESIVNSRDIKEKLPNITKNFRCRKCNQAKILVHENIEKNFFIVFFKLKDELYCTSEINKNDGLYSMLYKGPGNTLDIINLITSDKKYKYYSVKLLDDVNRKNNDVYYCGSCGNKASLQDYINCYKENISLSLCDICGHENSMTVSKDGVGSCCENCENMLKNKTLKK